jgi:hypothetical protein
MGQKKSGSAPKRRKTLRPTSVREEVLVQHAKRMRDNAALLLRVVAYLVQHSPQVAAHFREKGDARIPLDALSTDVDVGVVVEEGHLVIVPAPLPPVHEAPLTVSMVIDLLGLASKHATHDDVEAWSAEQRAAAADWAGREHAHASDNYDVERIPEPEHVKALPNVEGIDPSPETGGEWITRLHWPDGRRTAFAQKPGDPSSRREVPA